MYYFMQPDWKKTAFVAIILARNINLKSISLQHLFCYNSEDIYVIIIFFEMRCLFCLKRRQLWKRLVHGLVSFWSVPAVRLVSGMSGSFRIFAGSSVGPHLF